MIWYDNCREDASQLKSNCVVGLWLKEKDRGDALTVNAPMGWEVVLSHVSILSSLGFQHKLPWWHTMYQVNYLIQEVQSRTWSYFKMPLILLYSRGPWSTKLMIPIASVCLFMRICTNVVYNRSQEVVHGVVGSELHIWQVGRGCIHQPRRSVSLEHRWQSTI